MNTRLIALIAAACMSSVAVAQTTGSQGQTSGTGKNSTQTADRNAANSGEQNSAAMQNNGNAQNTMQGKTSKDRKAHRNSKNKADCNEAHTDGNATTPATARADCDNTTKTQQR
jgi:hypothetical protein